jgi:hypothetical protein
MRVAPECEEPARAILVRLSDDPDPSVASAAYRAWLRSAKVSVAEPVGAPPIRDPASALAAAAKGSLARSAKPSAFEFADPATNALPVTFDLPSLWGPSRPRMR